uniref:Uncharacterized protein n=1 Tax=Anguilla anguilla TaxID=7936 RepID=A0A0E9Q5X4_ANGAN
MKTQKKKERALWVNLTNQN